MDRPGQLFYRSGFFDEPARTRFEHVEQLRVLRQRRENENLHAKTERRDLARGGEPSLPGHGQVHQDDVGTLLLHSGDGFLSRARFAHHHAVRLLRQQLAQSGAKDDVIVD